MGDIEIRLLADDQSSDPTPTSTDRA